MTRFIHDQFAKQYLTELLTPYGQVETSKDITAEVRQIDVLFIPSSPPTNLTTLGVLGKMAANYAVFEPFRNAVGKSEIRSCMGKLFDIHAQIERQAKRNDTRINEAELANLWILTPTVSVEILDSFNATLDEENWGKHCEYSSITQYTRNPVFADIREGKSTKTSGGRIGNTDK